MDTGGGIKKAASWLWRKITSPPEETFVPDSYPMPNLLIPWEAWPEANEDTLTIMARARFGGILADWADAVWIPYWDSLSEQDREALLADATSEWREWIKLQERDISFVKKEHAKAGQAFDYREALKCIELRYYLLRKHGFSLANFP